jgi:hypothetical protein
MTELVRPSAMMSFTDAVMIDFSALAAPGMNVTVSLSAMVFPFTVAVMVAELTVVGAVRVTV